MRPVQEASDEAISVAEALSRSQTAESAADLRAELRSAQAQCAQAVEETASERRKVVQLQQTLIRTETRLSVIKRHVPVRAALSGSSEI